MVSFADEVAASFSSQVTLPPDDFGLTAAEVVERDGTEDEYTAPTSFRDWVATTFGVSIPERACEIVKATASMDEESSADPFWRWIRSYDR